MKKRIISLLLISCLCINSICYVCAADNNSSILSEEDTIALLKELGYSQILIDNMTDEQFQEYQQAIKFDITHKYYRVTEKNLQKNEFITTTDSNNVSGVIELTKEQFEKEISVASQNNSIRPNASDTAIDDTGYLTATVSIVKLSNGNCKINYLATWSKKPVHTKIDVYGAVTNAGTIDFSTITYNYVCTKDTYTNGVKTASTNIISTPTGLKKEPSGAALRVNLQDDTIQYNPLKNGYSFRNHQVSISYTTSYEGLSRVAAVGNYFHQETLYQITPSFSIDSSGTIGASISIEDTDVMTEMLPNPAVSMVY